MTSPILDIRNLSVHFKADDRLVHAVRDVSFHLMPSETLCVVGESGSGKSVTSLAVMGLLARSAQVTGEILFCDPRTNQTINLLELSPEEQRAYRGGLISMIFQEPMTSLNPVYTCGDQVVEAILLHSDLSREAAYGQAVDLFREVKLPDPEGMMSRYPHQLSGGQIQRVMIAMALSGNPAVLIADEPTTALDVTIQATILELMREIRDRRGMAILFITHDMGVVSEIADRVVVLYRGKVMEVANVYDLFANPQHPYTKGLLNCRPRPEQLLKRLPTVSDFMQVSIGPDGEPTIVPRSTHLVAADPRFVPVSAEERDRRHQELAQRPPLLSVRNLTKSYPVRTGLFGRKSVFNAVDHVSFDVFPGETLGLVGESGCGKSTLSRVLLRLVEPTSGEVMFDGKSVFKLNDAELRRLRQDMQIVFQNPYGSMDPRQSIGAALMEPMLIHNIGNSFQERYQRAVALLERVGLDASAMNRMPHEFSGGQQQRICIARTLTCNPRFIICDESVSALDVSVQAQVLNLLKDLQQDFGLTYIFISHDLSVVKFVSDRIMVMNQGKIEEIGPAETVYTHPTRDYTRQLIHAIPDATLDEIQERQRQRLLSSTPPNP
ncbi:ABC transporter ATP-binding protein [Thermocoleostomius sinensis]|uniref:ABC transporter ATP-binding protein n=1 Tax=Thermocoleostomius sinensis A174 TaxID=2016057 RepID=A0A9E9C535_9CYAN|nr:ABC transporter ATP-binding protein [Thermocoleostomius sinensis]WAL60691.1 ABC transporter ATP-binding protein [Thermocoleostomius sinensis A174]